ncbi:probable histone-lysine N-methyltransferase CG1716 [Dendroctonus ponderosae]|uniref:[histone H3]-lysine(36) N-trimethyltransferase n=1 Tax=Dendroctonus ponderosae TaxID=77166 RepID=A0AAR5PKE2_DENPD|nr:probable histone-lysine N-methyltransferase CG1716 [Dendroctonus ponderosae]XP_048521000.1 probable histone-lysine N-methyltransferase CG1716 [Dendroctonus ponderosae]
MPPKKRKPTPTVVGTVSTRSTRRESVVKIAIQNASPIKAPDKQSDLSPDNTSEEPSPEPAVARPEIMEILKDWSDDDDTNENMEIYRPQQETTDQQSLIDILEGRQPEPAPKEAAKSFPMSEHFKKSWSRRNLAENPVVNADSPKSDEPNIIEECVVDDDSFIIILPEEQAAAAKNDHQQEGCNSLSESFESFSISLESSREGDSKSVLSEDTSSQSMITVESDHNDVPTSENSLNHQNCDSTSEPTMHSGAFRRQLGESSVEKTLCKQITDTMKICEETNSPRRSEESAKCSSSSSKNQSGDSDVEIISPQLSPSIVKTKIIYKKTKQQQAKSPIAKIEVDHERTEDSQGKKGELLASEVVSKSATAVTKKSLKGQKTKTSSSKSLDAIRVDIDACIDAVIRKFTSEVDSDKGKPIASKGKVKKGKNGKGKKDEKSGELSEEVRRRSDRIKTFPMVKKKSHGLVKSKSEPNLPLEVENSDSNDNDKQPHDSPPHLSKPEKSKPKAKSTENLQLSSVSLPSLSPELPKPTDIKAAKSGQDEIEERLKSFQHLKENQYKTDRQVSKEAKDMVCDCYLAEEDIKNDEYGCGDDCLNKLLMIECGELCQVGDRCTNKRFQKSVFAPVEVFKTDKKGLGLRAAANIAYGEFILEYVGEVLNADEFDKRAEVYSKDKNIHFYFMSLRADAVIDATMRGNISRFINHSCDPNAETQKWTVNGELRIGFFSTRTILAGEEITFDYRFERYGKEAQKCYCEAPTCRGWLGDRPDESEDEDEEDEDEATEVAAEPAKPPAEESAVVAKEQLESTSLQSDIPTPMDTAEVASVSADQIQTEPSITPERLESPKKAGKKKLRKEVLFEDFDQLNDDIEMLVTTGLKNQAHTLKLSRLMVRSKDQEQRKKLLRVLRRGELPCRRLFLDYHGLRLMHGYMIDAQQLKSGDGKVIYTPLDIIQTKLELLQTLAVLPIQSKTILIESKVLPAVEKWAKNEDIVEEGDVKKSPNDTDREMDDPLAKEKIDETKFLATKLLEEWINLKESFRIPKKQRIEQMKEHEKEANRKFMESSYAQEKESSRKNDQRHRTWSRYKSEREGSKKSRFDDKDRPSAEFLKISKHERRKLFALQMELKEEERRLKQRELWRQHEMNCMMIGADPRFTAPFDPTKGFQYIWNPAVGQWQALPVPAVQNQGMYGSPAPAQGYNVPPHKQPLLGPYSNPLMNIPGLPGSQQYPALAPMVSGLPTQGVAHPGAAMPGSVHSLPGISQPPLQVMPLYQEVKPEDPSQVKFAGPIPPPAKLPPKWKCAKDKYGRPYYYHVKLRKSQWEPPLFPEPTLEDSSESSTSETSSSSESSSDYGTDEEVDDSKMLMDVRRELERTLKAPLKSPLPEHLKQEEQVSVTPSPEVKADSENDETEPSAQVKEESKDEPMSSIDIRLKEQFNLDNAEPSKKKRRVGLCQEIIISPRTKEDRQQFKEDVKRYKATKEKLKRQKEQMVQQAKKKLKIEPADEKPKKVREKRSSKTRTKETTEWNDENARKIKENFRSNMANTVVSVLNAYRKPDCKEARITNTEDFKHLARKLTHFVMLKEIKHLLSIDELVCTDNVKAKAREYIRKYMSKFGEVYQKRHDEPDFKD